MRDGRENTHKNSARDKAVYICEFTRKFWLKFTKFQFTGIVSGIKFRGNIVVQEQDKSYDEVVSI